jgi:hypothetical protein
MIETDEIALMNVFEAILNVEYLYLRHTSSRTVKLQPGQKDHRYHGHAPLVGFAAVVMTCAKTSLYMWQGESLTPLWSFEADVKIITLDGKVQDIIPDLYSGLATLLPICKSFQGS